MKELKNQMIAKAKSDLKNGKDCSGIVKDIIAIDAAERADTKEEHEFEKAKMNAELKKEENRIKSKETEIKEYEAKSRVSLEKKKAKSDDEKTWREYKAEKKEWLLKWGRLIAEVAVAGIGAGATISAVNKQNKLTKEVVAIATKQSEEDILNDKPVDLVNKVQRLSK